VRYESQTRIPFRVAGGLLVDFYTGKALPLTEGTVGDVVIDSIVVPEHVKRFLGKEERRIIALAGSRVLIGLSQATDRLAELIPHPLQKIKSLDSKPKCAAGRLTGDLCLLLRGTKKAKLQDAPVRLEGFQEDFVSINQAYTAASQRYETQRRSHSGNVFFTTFVDGPNGLTLLDDIRRSEDSAFEARTYVIVEGMKSAREWLLSTLEESPMAENDLLVDLKSQLVGTEPVYAEKILSALLEEFAQRVHDGRWALSSSTFLVHR
jgi:hypothetical protein